jgi:triphosphatase
MLADARYATLREEIKGMAAKLGAARNLDVFIASFENEPVPKALHSARRDAYAEARAAFDTPRWRTLMLDLIEWLTVGDWLTNPAEPSLCREPISHRASNILDRAWRRLERRGRGLARLDDHACHRVRIEAKKLRYAAEFFDALYPGKACQTAQEGIRQRH